MKNVNLSLRISKQDSLVSLLLAVFSFCLPFTALFSHGRIFLFLVLLFFAFVFYLFPQESTPAPSLFPYETAAEKKARRWLSLSDLFFAAYLLCVFSGVVIKKAVFPALMTSALCFFRLLPRKAAPHFSLYPLLLGGSAVALLSLLEFVLLGGDTAFADTSRFGDLARAGGVFGNPNLLAAYLLPLFAIALTAWEEKAEKRHGVLLSLLLLGAGIAVTYSRGAWAVALFWVGLYLLRRFGFIRPFLLFLAALPLLSLLLPHTVAARFLSFFSPDSSVGYRFSLWKSILRLPFSHLLFGVGEGKEALFSALSPYMAAGLERVEHTHSLFLHLLTANGIVGTAFFLLFLFFGLLGQTKAVRRGIFSLLLFGLFDDPLYGGQSEVLFWLLTGVF